MQKKLIAYAKGARILAVCTLMIYWLRSRQILAFLDEVPSGPECHKLTQATYDNIILSQQLDVATGILVGAWATLVMLSWLPDRNKAVDVV